MPHRGILRGPWEFQARPWEETLHWFDQSDSCRPTAALVRSIIRCGGVDRLVANTSMFDLRVTWSVDGEPGSAEDLITVRGAESTVRVPEGQIRIDHQSRTQPEESTTRPESEIIPLFWRFTEEKWGIQPWRWELMSPTELQLLHLIWAREPQGADGDHPIPGHPDDAGVLTPTGRDVLEAAETLLSLGIVEFKRRDPTDGTEDLSQVLAEMIDRPAERPASVGLVFGAAGAKWYASARSSSSS